MARQIIVERGEHTSSFAFSKLSREKLYGTKKRVVVDGQGRACVAAALTSDGSALLPPGSTASLYVTDDGDMVERSELTPVDVDGNPLETHGSTLGVPQALEGPLDPAALLDVDVTSVYVLDPADVEAALLEGLKAGEIYRIPFVYRASPSPSLAYLVGNDEGFFALIGREVETTFIQPDEAAPEFDDREDDPFDDDDDLDFGMM